MKTIGLIGGMSWESTALYYRKINQLVSERMGKLHSAPIVLYSLDFEPIAQMQRDGDWDKAGIILADSARRVCSAGADIFALATNTMHLVAPQIQGAVPIPFIHIAAPTAYQLKANGIKKVGLLGTKFTMEMPFYSSILEQQGLEVLIPEKGREEINRIIFEELCRGDIKDSSRQTFIQIIEELKTQGAEAVILGCTEIGLLISPEQSLLPTYDTTDLHVRALVDMAMAG